MILGIREVNLYNCTKIISSWCRIPREKRIQKVIHKKIIARLCPGIVDVPFNPYSFRHSRHLPPSLSKIVPYWCRDIVLYCYAMDTEYWARFTIMGIRQTRLNHFCWAFRNHETSKTQGAQSEMVAVKRSKEMRMLVCIMM